MVRSPSRTLLTILMNLIIACAIALTLRLCVEFFGNLAAQGWGEAVVALTDFFVIPFGFHDVKTPYGGVFDVNASIMIGLLIIVEWILSGVRDNG